MRVTLWGTRGSLPSCGPDTVRYGGNTACVEVRGDDGTLLILDAGSGIRALGAAMDGPPGRIDILLTHLHLDHLQGLGFFAPLFGRSEVHIWGPPSTTADLRDRLGRYLSPPLFPVRLRDLASEPVLHNAPDAAVRIGSLLVQSALIIHPGPTVGYRISEGDRSLAYLPDHEPALGAEGFPGASRWTSGGSLAAGVDVLIHDAQYTDQERAARIGWGHSTFGEAAAFAALAGVGRLVTFHHDPSHGDDALDDFHRRIAESTSIIVEPGREGLVLQV